MIRGLFWMGVAYIVGIFAFTLAALFDRGLGNDGVAALVESFSDGVIWPLTLYALITGNIGA